MGENPFLKEEEQKEEKEYIPKPYQKEELTEAQKERNFRGLKIIKKALEKIKPFRVYK